ncbi:AAA family ATPase [Curtobacterium flaccumfaciens]|uniref:AAA family ATPase n=1 Tax=Curtobacterium flaccumfaciens TaxID=2035 RepID=UPI001BE0F736|nr:AAA family ATPase [Curtobacterium flaccumfaciens]MBT1583518.1 AAA family ATPase [Curtobacterium flaccumfaciens pv. flaccumfaciens]MCX2798081.1 AAA family ATPase [Curtobacterium flaccumfaciens pv. flaccumfaciens]
MTTNVVSLTRARVTGVLGEYDHEFSIPSADEFVILYGPNGVGKTKFLEIIDAVSHLRISALLMQPFSTIELEYSDGSNLEILLQHVEEHSSAGQPESVRLRLVLRIPDHDPINWVYAGDDFESWLLRSSPWRQIGGDLWEDRTDGETVYLDELRDRFGRQTPGLSQPPDAVREFLQQVPSFLIETQRLRIEQANESRARVWFPPNSKERRQHRSRIAEQAASIRDLVTAAQTEHSRITQQLDRTFPNRVLEADVASLELDADLIRARYNEQNSFRSRLGHVASVALEDALSLPERDLEIWERKLLSLYLDDTDRKLAPFENLLQKIELLEQIINSRLLNKELHVTDGEGLSVIHATARRGIELNSLSSGEQHEIILMIDLLFNVPQGAVVLIDEPEISLHVAWQLAFIPDVRRIAALAGFRFVVATHSPQIINDSWDKSVRLGPREAPFQ